ncbi:MAG: hypothetical protein JRH11_06310 [Deltaproteobacteria bacterium]|nr:hypothetical protein [Deltaproteobacteria bacterium]
MGTAVANIRRVRKQLTDDFSPVMARAILFDALTQWGPRIPQSREELARFVRGPLRDVLLRHRMPQQVITSLLEIETALAVVDHLDDQSRPRLGPSTRPPPPMSAPVSADTTVAIRAIARPVHVLVASLDVGFAPTIEVALGGSLVRTDPVASELGLRSELEREIDIILIDAMQPLDVEPTRLAFLLNRIEPGTLIAVWGSRLAWGRDIIGAIEAGGLATVPFSIAEGMAPFVDLVRSRQGD